MAYDNSTSEIGNLERHISSIHKKQMPSKCKECNYSISHISRLNKHVNSIHKNINIFKAQLFFVTKKGHEKDKSSIHVERNSFNSNNVDQGCWMGVPYQKRGSLFYQTLKFTPSFFTHFSEKVPKRRLFRNFFEKLMTRNDIKD